MVVSWLRRGLEPYALSPAIASGGMGTVQLAVARDPAQPVLALKRVHRHLAVDPSFSRMLATEAATAMRVMHENVVTTYGADAMGDEVVLVMEYVHGLTLRAIAQLCRERPLPPRIAGAIVAGALRGLHAAHEATDSNGERMRLVHCDVSPQNILVGVDGRARILDFGVAKPEERRAKTHKGEVHCKLAYASPEQLTGAGVDRRTDVFSAAIVLWESLVGRPLFSAPGEWNVVASVLAGDITRPRHIVPEIPRALEAVVMRGLNGVPRDRFATALEMAEAIDAVFAREPVVPAELGAWMRSLVGAEEALQERARWVSELRRRARRVVAPRAPSLVSRTMRSAVPFSVWRHLSAQPRAIFGLYCIIFLGALAGGLIGTRALSHGHDEPLGAQRER